MSPTRNASNRDDDARSVRKAAVHRKSQTRHNLSVLHLASPAPSGLGQKRVRRAARKQKRVGVAVLRWLPPLTLASNGPRFGSKSVPHFAQTGAIGMGATVRESFYDRRGATSRFAQKKQNGETGPSGRSGECVRLECLSPPPKIRARLDVVLQKKQKSAPSP